MICIACRGDHELEKCPQTIEDVNGDVISFVEYFDRLKFRQIRGLVPEQIGHLKDVNGVFCTNFHFHRIRVRVPSDNCKICDAAWIHRVKRGILVYMNGYVFGKPFTSEGFYYRRKPQKRRVWVPNARYVEKFDCRKIYRFSREEIREMFPDVPWPTLRQELKAVKFRQIAVRRGGKVEAGFGRDPIADTFLGPFSAVRIGEFLEPKRGVGRPRKIRNSEI